MTQEGIDLILRAWQTSKPFSWEGENYNSKNVSTWPTVAQSRSRPFTVWEQCKAGGRFLAKRPPLPFSR